MLFQDAMAAAMVDHGIDTVFGLIGDGNLFVMDSYRRQDGTTYVSVVHEAAAVEAASGFAQISGRLGVATVTHGPALTNTLTPLVDAVKGRVPLLLLAGDTRESDRFHVQNIDQRALAQAAGAGFEQVRSPQTAVEDLATAVRRALTEKRPIVLNMPVDFQWAEAEYRRLSAVVPPVSRARPTAEDLDTALGIIASARRPLVLAGRGAVDPRSRAAILRFAVRIGAPVATTLKARDLFRGEPHDLGICGTVAHELAQATFAASDCVIAFGASLNQFTTVGGSLAEGRALVHVDDDPAALGRYLEPDAGIVSDASACAEAFVELLDEAGIEPTGFASPELAAQLAAQLADRAQAPADRSTDEYVDIHTAIRLVDAAVDASRTVVTDSGRFVHSAWPVIGVEDPRHFAHTANFGSIGLGMGTALGAAYARPGHPTLLITGDGGFMLGGLGEFSSAVRHGLDLIVLLLNDGSYGAEHIQFVRRELDPQMSVFTWPDFGPVAEAFGARGYTIRSVPQLVSALAQLPGLQGPVLLDVHVNPYHVPSMH